MLLVLVICRKCLFKITHVIIVLPSEFYTIHTYVANEAQSETLYAIMEP